MRSIIQVSQAVQIPSVTMLMISRSSRTGLDQFITANDILKPGTLVAADFKYSLFPPKDVPQGSKYPLLLYAKTVEDITVDFLGHLRECISAGQSHRLPTGGREVSHCIHRACVLGQ
ncbi:hypothetical protein BDW68DRAFT_171651 [Aspergillus falconensis]